jgi:hypothetical protein
MKSIVLHIGYPKTATSSIQWFLDRHRDSLRAQGVCYPATGQVDDHAHHKLAFSLEDNAYERWSDADRTRLFDDLAAEIDASDADTIVLSSELFLYRLEPIQRSAEFARILNGRPLRVICFLRKQTTFMESLYRHFIWDAAMRFAEGPDAFLARYPFAGDYHMTLGAWAAFVGKDRIVPVIYEQARNGEGCVKAFCRLIGIDPERFPADDFHVRHNVTVAPNVVTEIVRIANGCPELSREQLIELTARAREFGSAIDHLPVPRRLFGSDLVARVEAMYLESNRKLSDEFVRQPLEGAWFREHLDRVPTTA